MQFENIKIVNDLLNSGKLTELKGAVAEAEKFVVKSFKVSLAVKSEEIEKRLNEELEKEALKASENVFAEEKVAESTAAEEKPKKKSSAKTTAEKKAETAPVEATETEETEIKEEKPVEDVVAETSEQPAQPAKKSTPSFIVRRAEFVPENRPKRAEFTPSPRQREGGFTRSTGTAGRDIGAKKSHGGSYVAPAVLPTDSKRSFGKKNKGGGDKQYEEKRSPNKRALIKNNVTIEDFDENKTGYRKFRPVKKEKAAENVIKIEKAVITQEIIPLKVLSEKIGVTAAELTKRLFKEGIMKTINDSIDFDTAAYIADELGVELELKLEKSAEDVLSEGFDDVADAPEKLKRRPPVVTVMGHVDHGKTSLLDRIRKTNVTAGEAGGITQHIGAYQVTVNGETITFLDTPGHAAFTAMRARGAQATDIAILVVAADDGIMPQTIEAINHAKAANVPVIVAINKMDKPEANPEKVKTELTEHGLLPEEWGGDTIVVPVSAKTGEGLDKLLENINLVAEIKDLKANPDRKAKGIVIEAKLDTSKGPIATILIQNGTLKVGDSVVVGTVTGKIRAMTDDKGRKVGSAKPSDAVSVMGLDEVPAAGDTLYAVEQDKLMKMVAEERRNKERESMIKAQSKISLDDVFNRISEGEMKGLNIIVKADVQGSVEAVKSSLEKLSNEEVKVNVIHAAVGAIKESDIMLAESSKAVIIGFNVRPDANAKAVSEHSGVEIKLYRVIYEAIEDVEKALKGMLAPKITETYMGKAEVREVFKISGVGQVAGCYVVEGKIIRGGKLRIYRDDVMICEGNVLQLKRFKDDVKEVAQGFECGISIEKFNDIKVGDFIESYEIGEEKA
ncbi:MAG: translation initiation factor IF-2 [Clostridia bacterium]|nr:translation initiation factor IF-2 [Clostridia bacterium]